MRYKEMNKMERWRFRVKKKIKNNYNEIEIHKVCKLAKNVEEVIVLRHFYMDDEGNIENGWRKGHHYIILLDGGKEVLRATENKKKKKWVIMDTFAKFYREGTREQIIDFFICYKLEGGIYEGQNNFDA